MAAGRADRVPPRSLLPVSVWPRSAQSGPARQPSSRPEPCATRSSVAAGNQTESSGHICLRLEDTSNTTTVGEPAGWSVYRKTIQTSVLSKGSGNLLLNGFHHMVGKGSNFSTDPNLAFFAK